MALNIRNPEAEQLAGAVAKAVRNRLARLQRERSNRRLADELDEIARHCAALPVQDPRTADEILGYDERGMPR